MSQPSGTECGLACLAMTLGSFGVDVGVDTLRRHIQADLGGVSVRSLIEAARAFGLAGRVARVDLDGLAKLRTPAILHWNFDHFVVMQKVTTRHIHIIDPAYGPIRLAPSELSRCFTGVALEFETTADLVRQSHILRASLTQLWTRSNGVATSTALLLAVTILIQALLIIGPLLLPVLVDQVGLRSPTSVLLPVIGWFLLVYAAIAALDYVRRALVGIIGDRVKLAISLNVVTHVLRLPLAFFQSRRLNDLVSRMEHVRDINDLITEEALPTVIDGTFALVTVAVIVMINPWCGLVAAIGSAIYLVAKSASYLAIRQRTMRSLDDESIARGMQIENVRGIQTIKTLSAEAIRTSSWFNMSIRATTSKRELRRLKDGLISTRTAITGLEQVMMIAIAFIQVRSGTLTLGAMLAVLAFRQQLQDRSYPTIDRLFELRVLGLYMDRLGDLTGHGTEQAIGHESVDINAGSAWGVSVDAVSYRYGPDRPLVLDRVSLDVPAGGFVAITGASGFGKTTLVRILLGLIDPSEGSVSLLDGIGGSASPRACRRGIAAVMQDDLLFSGSVLDNIGGFDPVIDEDRAIDVARLAQVHDEILAMPLGYYSFIGDMGSALSGGQKQRILLARALYRRPKVLILDEGTANLDVENERRIVAMLADLPCTKICIAHRAATLARADRIVRLGSHGPDIGRADEPAPRSAEPVDTLAS